MQDAQGRYFCTFDDEGRLASQRDLIEKLERLSFEQGDRRILTAHYGVPITVFLLLLRDSIERLRGLDQQLRNRKKSLGSVPHAQAMQYYGLQTKPAHDAASMTGLNWAHETVVGVYEAGALSGVVAASDIHILTRPSNVPFKDVYESTKPDTVVFSNVIKVGGGKSQDVPLVDHIKDVMLSLELFYAIQERIAVECKRFATQCNATPINTGLPSDFLTQSQRRGALIHEGELRLGVDSVACALTVKDRPIVDEFSRAFDGGIEAIAKVYAAMCGSLH